MHNFAYCKLQNFFKNNFVFFFTPIDLYNYSMHKNIKVQLPKSK